MIQRVAFGVREVEVGLLEDIHAVLDSAYHAVCGCGGIAVRLHTKQETMFIAVTEECAIIDLEVKAQRVVAMPITRNYNQFIIVDICLGYLLIKRDRSTIEIHYFHIIIT